MGELLPLWGGEQGACLTYFLVFFYLLSEGGSERHRASLALILVFCDVLSEGCRGGVRPASAGDGEHDLLPEDKEMQVLLG